MNNQTFEQEKELLKIKMDLLNLEHKQKMERLSFERESALKFHDLALQRERIKSAEIKRAQERQNWKNFGENYVK